MKSVILALASPAFALFGSGPFKNIPGEVLDVPGYNSVTQVVVIAGNTKYPQAQKKLLSELEKHWKEDGCWRITGHEEAKAQFRPGLAPAPSLSKWGAGKALERMVFGRLPERDSKTGVLVFWVLGWEGEKYVPPAPLTVNVNISIGGSRRRNNAALPSGPPPYSRIAVAQLFDSKTGKELWRAYKSMGRGIDPTGPGEREEQKRVEFLEFIEFFWSALTSPENMEKACAPAQRAVAKPAPAPKQRANPLEEPMRRLQSSDSEERAAAAKALGAAGGAAAVNALIATLKDENLKVRGMAAKALGDIKDERAVEPLIALLNDQSKYIRALGAQALGAIGDGRARGPLKKLENDKEELVRKEAGIALKKLWMDPSDMDMDFDMGGDAGGPGFKDGVFASEELKLE
jgi:hypothetical protein